MTDLIVQNLEDDLRDKLEDLARSHGHSVEEEARDILRGVVLAKQPPVPAPAQGLGSRIAARFSGSGIGLTDEESKAMELRGQFVAQPLDFDK